MPAAKTVRMKTDSTSKPKHLPPNFWKTLRNTITRLGGFPVVAKLPHEPEARIRLYLGGVVPPSHVLAILDRLAGTTLVQQAALAPPQVRFAELERTLVRRVSPARPTPCRGVE